MKEGSVLYGAQYRAAVQSNIERFSWARALRDDAVSRAAYFASLSDETLWNLVFGHTLPRSHTVLSDGDCPDCGRPVPMAGWVIDAVGAPWKVRCPHCAALFPKNDFKAYYDSGLDEWGVFRQERADERLLTADGEPGRSDSAYRPGVDDGFGCVTGWCTQRRWYFIAHYLAVGQWKQLVVGGVRHLAAAYLFTGRPLYAHKAGVLLDRIADVLPWFDYHRQGLVYERPGDMGYVTTWHDSNYELRALALAYDSVYEAIQEDSELTAFLREKSRSVRMVNPKENFSDIRRNIESRILEDVLENPRKVTLNYPGTESLLLLIKLVLGRTGEALEAAGEIVKTATAVDGVTGERGIGGYAGVTTDLVFHVLETVALAEPDAVPGLLRLNPSVEKAFRFFTDIYTMGYYPRVGDTSYFAGPMRLFSGLDFVRRIPGTPGGVTPGFNLFSLLYKLYRLTGASYYLGTLRRAVKEGGDSVVWDIGEPDVGRASEAVQSGAGDENLVRGVNLRQWKLAVLRSGEDCAAWIHYQPWVERHGHNDALNIGLLAYGLDLLPDCGYPPVQYGGWFTPEVRWYAGVWSHNAVVVDRDERPGARSQSSRTTLWVDEDGVQAIAVDAAGLRGTTRYERALCLLRIPGAGHILFDIFRVEGGREHILPIHSSFGTLTANFAGDETLSIGGTALFRHMRGGMLEGPLCADWEIEDRYGLARGPVRMRVLNFTEDRAAYGGEMWINAGPNAEKRGEYVPALLLVRRGEAALRSDFETVYVPWRGDGPTVGVCRTGPYRYQVTPPAGGLATVNFCFPDGGEPTLTVQWEGGETRMFRGAGRT